jgi:hypothetical protein
MQNMGYMPNYWRDPKCVWKEKHENWSESDCRCHNPLRAQDPNIGKNWGRPCLEECNGYPVVDGDYLKTLDDAFVRMMNKEQ